MAKLYKIHPAIGIARVGTSDEFYVGPEIPGNFARPADNKYRDQNKRLRRQAARFWVFEHDDAEPGRAPIPVVAGQDGLARIEWTVHLSNKKAVWFVFDELRGITGDESEGVPYPTGWPLRNQDWIPADQPEERRRRLVIDPGPRQLTDRNQRVEIQKGNGGGFPETWPGRFFGGKEITSLGTMITDDRGRLVVAGGFGTSGAAEADAVPADGRLPSFVNNDKWFDDISDGSVVARLVFDDGSTAEVVPAWLIVGPPDYAPPIENIVTMYDLLYDLALRELGLDAAVFDPQTKKFQAEYRPSFTREIFPILKRAFDYRWVIQQASSHPRAIIDFASLAAPPPAGEDPDDNPRVNIFSRIRNPDDLDGPSDRNMPRLHNDGTGGIQPETFKLSVTRTQFNMLSKWAAGQFQSDWNGVPTPPADVTATGLDQAMLEAACGGSFFPGIEAGWILRDKRIYSEPFRFRHATAEGDPSGVMPGDLTKRSALPWQADFLKCGNNWWPAQRPNQVRLNENATSPSQWDRGINSHVALVEKWSLLGVVKPADNAASPAKFHESERELA